MGRTFRWVLSVMTAMAFILLYLCTKDEVGIIALPVLIAALIGALRIIWKKNPEGGNETNNGN